MVAEPTSLGDRERREVSAVVVDGWTACGGCMTRIAFGITAVDAEARVKCYRCGVWVRLRDRLRERVSRTI